ncbi:MAG: penicillin acylase family protein [Chrysiogenales bacterium]|nr:MAG: penicillin acylase family protein [Chrysiogenales bacterium]
MKKIVIAAVCIVVIAVISGFLLVRRAARIQTSGEIRVEGLDSPVTVIRDEKGMPFIYAKSIPDALRAQGFIAAQDRLFQMELSRMMSQGRISELAGEMAKNLDIKMRALGFLKYGKKHAAILSPKSRDYFNRYLEGVNRYIETRKGEFPLEFTLAGITPGPWTIEDSLALLYYMGWTMSANIQTEMISQMLNEKLGAERARELLPLNINPDNEAPAVAARASTPVFYEGILDLQKDPMLALIIRRPRNSPAIGSNNWVVASRLSESGMPVVANDPHLDAGMVPGQLYPAGIITPEVRAVGVILPGVPGIIIGRNEHMAIGMTNSYGDGQDLYIETIDPSDPGHYMEGNRSIPFEISTETLKIKDGKAKGGYREETVTIRHTRRGPVVSGVLSGFKTERVVTVRWTPYETMGPEIGLDEILTARSVRDIRRGLGKVTMGMFNFVFADREGAIGWQTTGRLPVRSQGDSTAPYPVRDGRDNWTGWIPYGMMLQSQNPPSGWVGTCNHDSVPRGYPYYISSFFAPGYRYRRLKELVGGSVKIGVEDHWRWQRDAKNLMAVEIAPIMAAALKVEKATAPMGALLADWDHVERADSSAPLIFQAIYREFACQVFRDELGEDLTKTFLDVKYYWKRRLHRMVVENSSSFFDDITTKERETRDDLFRRAALAVKGELSSRFGSDPAKWRWGGAHRLTLVSPIMRSGPLKGLFGGGSHPMDGSAETLYRATFKFSKPYDVSTGAGLRMVADLGDPDRVLAVLPGGVSGRVFNPHTTDQIDAYMDGEIRYWWFSDKMIRENGKSSMILRP